MNTINNTNLKSVEHTETSIVDRSAEVLRYGFYSFLLLALSPLLVAANGVIWITNRTHNDLQAGSAEIKERLHQFVHSDEESSVIEEFMMLQFTDYLAESMPESSLELFIDIFSADTLQPFLREILKGANVKISDDGYFYDKWSEMPDCYKRISSHDYQEDLCCGKPGNIMNAFLFWKDQDGDTRFQIEKTPTAGPFWGIPDTIFHLADYLPYKRDGVQQSQFGQSIYTENYCIQVSFDMKDYLAKKEVLESQISGESGILAAFMNPLKLFKSILATLYASVSHTQSNKVPQDSR